MKIIEINTVCYGSTGRIACSIAQYAKEVNNDEVFLAYGRGNSVGGINTIKIGSNLSIFLHVFISRIFDRTGFGSKIATKKLIKKIKQIKPDIIHLHNLHGYYINIKVLFEFLKKEKIKVVWTLHDCWSFTGHCCHFESLNCNNWQKKCFNCNYKKVYPRSLFFSDSKRNYNAKEKIFTSLDKNQMIIVTPSNWLYNLVIKSFLSKYSINIINNGIDLNIFSKMAKDNLLLEKFNLQEKKVIIGVASVWTEKKGFNDFIELSKSLNDDYRIIMIGLNKNQMKILPANIIGIERTNSQLELAKWYNIADVLYNPTKEDTYPTILLEAIACGTNILTSNVGGCIEIAMLSKNYEFIEIDNVENQIKKLCSIGRNELINNSIDLSNENTIEKYYNLFNNLKTIG